MYPQVCVATFALGPTPPSKSLNILNIRLHNTLTRPSKIHFLKFYCIYWSSTWHVACTVLYCTVPWRNILRTLLHLHWRLLDKSPCHSPASAGPCSLAGDKTAAHLATRHQHNVWLARAVLCVFCVTWRIPHKPNNTKRMKKSGDEWVHNRIYRKTRLCHDICHARTVYIHLCKVCTNRTRRVLL